VLWNGASLYHAFNLPATPWTNLQFVVTAISEKTVLQIGGRDDSTALGVDDINLVSISAPVFRTVIASGTALIFSWSSQPGLRYQVQYSSHLDPPDWANLGIPITATNGTIALSDPIAPGANSVRFYRVSLLP
jgi:hypothetical protein